ncbi:Hsp70 family protein [Paraburkholderia sp. J41]|uniref:Hsp70 family protein n=1 Tax=Paraburkholderia sp. J41 TaxID=2805433 RepID=UPI002AC310C4|nr:Hsp70 family protein [Paraburkholderia sp. J41]
MSYCAIDFGTSNSAIVLPHAEGMRLATVENGRRTLPTAVFFNADEHTQSYGRAALAAYIEGHHGRLMRSIKSILGSALAQTSTDMGNGSAIRYTDVIALFLAHLKRRAEAEGSTPLLRAVLGRPVFFVDDDPRADAQAEQQFADAARAVGFREIVFQYEPIAAAFDYEARLADEQRVLVADIGGGTSDFSLVRVGPRRRARAARRDDVLAHHGVHVAGTDFDRRVALAAIQPALGYRSIDTQGREMPSRLYFDLATWHLVNTVYTPRRAAELRLMRHLFRDPAHHARAMRVVEHRLGHALLAQAEQAKIAVSAGGTTRIGLDAVEPGLHADFDAPALVDASRDDTARIVEAARDTARLAGVREETISALYFTGGSTGLEHLTGAIARAFPHAHAVFGDRLASVATGLGIHARRVFGEAGGDA